MDVLIKAKELGSMIAESEELTRFKKYEALVKHDEKAQELMNDYRLLQAEVMKAAKERRDEVVVESIKERMMKKQDEINNYELTKNYLESKDIFDQYVKQINDVLMYSMTGEQSRPSHSCGSCGGCK